MKNPFSVRFRTSFLLMALMIVSYCCKSPQPVEKNPSALEFQALAETFLQEWLARHPLLSTRMGGELYNDKLPDDISQEFMENLEHVLQKYLGKLESLDREELDDRDRLTLEIWDYYLRVSLEGLKFNLQRGSWLDSIKPIHQWAESFPTSFPVQASGVGFVPFKTVADYDNFLKRLEQFSVKIDTAIKNMRLGLQTGDTHPRACMEKVIPQLDALIADRVEESLFYRPILNMPPEIPGSQKDRIAADYARMIRGEINPAYAKLRDFMENEYVPGCGEFSVLPILPGGKEKYIYLIRYFTTTDKSPDEIYETGLREVERIKSEMEKIRRNTGFSGDLGSFLDYVKNDLRFFPFQTVAEVLDTFDGFSKKIEPQLDGLFTRIPRAGLKVRATEKFREGGTNAYYAGPTAEDPNLCIFYEPVPDPKKYNAIAMESLYIHEGIPGHHFQMSLHREADLPEIRKHLGFDAYSEGWALYVESLGKELGLYRDPYQVLGRLSNEMERAVRLVVDVGLHWKGWSREKAIQYILENQPVDEATAVKRAERYMVAPGQALAYKIGELKMMDIRRKAEEKLGERFDLRAFHDEVLKDGPMPLLLLEAKMDRWMEKIAARN